MSTAENTTSAIRVLPSTATASDIKQVTDRDGGVIVEGALSPEENRTPNGSRRGLTMTCSLGWLKPEEAQTLAVSRERARGLPPRMRELVSLAGYRPYGPDVATVVSHRLDMKDPYEVIFDEQRPTTN